MRNPGNGSKEEIISRFGKYVSSGKADFSRASASILFSAAEKVRTYGMQSQRNVSSTVTVTVASSTWGTGIRRLSMPSRRVLMSWI